MVSLGALLDIRDLDLRPVVSNRSDDPLRWVATSELADPSPFLEGGEILLTTGLGTANWNREWGPYVARLADAGVVAVGLAIDLTHTASPAALVLACRDQGVDLFEVPEATTFVRISRSLALLLESEEETSTRAALRAQRMLVQAALRDDLPALLEELARLTDLAAIVAADGEPLLGPRGRRADLFEPHEVAEAVARMRPQGLRAGSSLSALGTHLLIQPLGVRGRPARYLVTGFAGRVSESQRATVSTAAALFSLAEERRRQSREADRGIRARATELLCAGDLRTASVLLGASAGMRRGLPRQAAVVVAQGPKALLDEALEQLEDGGELAGLQMRAGVAELTAVLRPERVRKFGDRLAAGGVRVGVGEVTTLATLPRSHQTARYSMEMTSDHSPVVMWDQAVNAGVMSLVSSDRAAAFGERWLAPIESEPDGILLETLRSFLTNHGSLLKVAADLGIHRNTVRHRIERIQTLLGRSLDDPQVRVDAWVALQGRSSAASKRGSMNSGISSDC